MKLRRGLGGSGMGSWKSERRRRLYSEGKTKINETLKFCIGEAQREAANAVCP